MLTEIIAITGVAVAIWQLHLQRLEIKRASKVQNLQYLALLLQSRIDTLEAVINDKKLKKQAYKHLAVHVNTELKPQYQALVTQLANHNDIKGLDSAIFKSVKDTESLKSID